MENILNGQVAEQSSKNMWVKCGYKGMQRDRCRGDDNIPLAKFNFFIKIINIFL